LAFGILAFGILAFGILAFGILAHFNNVKFIVVNGKMFFKGILSWIRIKIFMAETLTVKKT
jgi:hypothetical protein